MDEPQPTDIELAESPAGELNLLQAASVFYRWRQAALKANFRKELTELLDAVSEEEEGKRALQAQHTQTRRQLEEAHLKLAQAVDLQRTTQLQADQLQAQNDELFRALETAEAARRLHCDHAEAGKSMFHEEVARRREDRACAQTEAEGMRAQQRAQLAQQQSLLDRLSQREQQVSELTASSQRTQTQLRDAQDELGRLHTVVRATGERAAAAEAQAQTKHEQVTALYAELGSLRERYYHELSDLKAARVAAADASRLQERLDAVACVNAALIGARDEMRSALESALARAAGAEERMTRLVAASALRDAIVEAAAHGGDEPGAGSRAVSAMASELELRLAENAGLAERLAAATAVAVQHEAHISRLAADVAVGEACLREAREHKDALARANAELYAEMQRLAAESALGPLMVMDADGHLTEAPRAPPASAESSAPAASQMEAQATAVRVILADRTFGLAALGLALKESPSEVAAIRNHMAACLGVVQDVRTHGEAVSEALALRPLDVSALADAVLPPARKAVDEAQGALLAARDGLAEKQVAAVGVEAALLRMEAELKQSAAQLGSWSGLMSGAVVSLSSDMPASWDMTAARDTMQSSSPGRGGMNHGDGYSGGGGGAGAAAAVVVAEGALEPDVRMSMRQDLKACEAGVYRALSELLACAPVLLAGDAGWASTETGIREAQNALLEAAAALADRTADAVALRSKLLSAEVCLGQHAARVERLRAVVGGVPGSVASYVERLTALLRDLDVLAPALQEMQATAHACLQAGGMLPPLDAAALQAELFTLRGLLRSKERAVQEMESAGGALRPSLPGGKALKLVPMEALEAAARTRAAVEAEKAALASRLAAQRVRMLGARHKLLAHAEGLRMGALMTETFHKWRMLVALGLAERARDVARAESEAAGRMRGLMCSRAGTLKRVLARQADKWLDTIASAVLYYWQRQALRQVAARMQLRGMCTSLLAQHDAAERRAVDDARRRDTLLYGPSTTIAQRLVLMHQDWTEPVCVRAIHGAQVGRLVLRLWRAWARLKAMKHQLEQMTEGVPQWIAGVGERRRMERAWLAWRLDTAHTSLERSQAAYREAQRASEAAAAQQAAADEALAQAQAGAGQGAGGEEEEAGGHVDSERSVGGASERSARPSSIRQEHSMLTITSNAPGQPSQRQHAGRQQGAHGPKGSLAVSGAYLPAVHTVLAPQGRAPSHSKLEEAVLAAQVAQTAHGQGGLDAVTGPGYLAAAERAAQAVQSYRTSEAARQSANPSVSVVVHPLGSDPHLQGHGMPATGTAAGYSGGTHFGQAGGFNATLPPPPQLGTGIPAPAGTPLPGMPLHMSSGAGRSGTLGSAQMATSTGGGQAGTAPAQIRMGPGSMTHGSVVASGRVQGSSRVGSAAGTGPARPKWGSGGGAAGSKQGGRAPLSQVSTNTTAAITNTTTINVHDAVAQGGPTLPQRKTPVVPSLAPPIRAAPLALLAAAPQPKVLRLAERAARLAGAVEGLRQGLADSAEVLSPRTRVLQAVLMAATADQRAHEFTGTGMVVASSLPERPGSPLSPTHRTLRDATATLYPDNSRGVASSSAANSAVNSPVGSPKRASSVASAAAAGPPASPLRAASPSTQRPGSPLRLAGMPNGELSLNLHSPSAPSSPTRSMPAAAEPNSQHITQQHPPLAAPIALLTQPELRHRSAAYSRPANAAATTTARAQQPSLPTAGNVSSHNRKRAAPGADANDNFGASGTSGRANRSGGGGADGRCGATAAPSMVRRPDIFTTRPAGSGEGHVGLEEDPFHVQAPHNSVQMLLGKLPGRFDPLQDAARPVTRVVPHATAAAAVAALGDSVAAAAYTIAPSAGLPNKRQDYVDSRLKDSTITTLAKQAPAGQPLQQRGLTGLVHMPVAPMAPLRAPITTYVPQENSVPGPLTSLGVVQQGLQTGAPAMADLAAMLTGLESHPAAQTVPSGQPLMYASAAAQQAGSSARTQQQQRRGQQHSAALVQTSSGHAGAARATYAGAAAGAGNSGSSANTMNANAFGGNVTPAQRAAGSKVVRFERLSPAPGDSISPGAHGAGEGDIRSSGVSAAANATAPVTYIRLPSPVKVNIRVQGAN